MKCISKTTKMVAKNSATCKCCAKPIEKGDEVVKATTPKLCLNSDNGYYFHKDCAENLDGTTYKKNNNGNSTTNSKRCIDHRIIVNGCKDDFAYFAYENAFVGKQFGKFVKWCSPFYTNAQSIGSVVSTILKNDLRVWVEYPNGEKVEVHNKKEYKNVTDLGWL